MDMQPAKNGELFHPIEIGLKIGASLLKPGDTLEQPSTSALSMGYIGIPHG